MALLRFDQLSFAYPLAETRALDEVTLEIQKGEYVVLCGPSGCGKSTLLRQLKTVLAPHGVTEGEVYFQGTPLREIPLRQQAADIGFVLQSPEQQVVTDKVWHELAFGLESLGCDTRSFFHNQKFRRHNASATVSMSSPSSRSWWFL